MKYRLLSVLLIVAVMASALTGAMAVSVLPAKADDFPDAGYLDDLFAAAFEDVPSENRVTLEYYQSLFDERFDDYLIVVIHDTVLNGWYFAAYDGTGGADPVRWCLNNSSYTPYYTTLIAKYTNNGYYQTDYNFIAGCKFQGLNWSSHGGTAMGNTSLSQFVNWSTGWQYLTPNPLYLNMSGYECYSNRDLYKWNNDDPTDSRFMVANLNPGSDIPPVIEYHWFKFNLGDRWYITTYDQSLMSMLQQGDSTFWVWTMYASKLSDPDNPEYMFIWWPDVQYLSFAETFIIQNLTNVSSSGVLAYDITDLILNPDYTLLGIADFYQVLDTTSGYVLGNLVAESTDQVDLNLSPAEEGQTQNEAWNVINNYVINYPSVTVAPEDLADQLFGDTAYTGFMGDIRIPYSIGLHFGLFGNDINLCDAYFHYWLYESGLGADENSILNFDLFNACVVAAPQINRNVYVAYWDTDDPQSIDYSYVGLMDTQDLLDTFDLLLIAPASSEWLEEVDGSFPPFSGSSAGYTNLNQESPLTARGVEGVYPVYIIVSHKAISKSQLYVFCDCFSKLYDLAVDFCNNRDLWNSSFFDWSMSMFWELETVNGHLFAIENEILGWKLSIQFEKLFDKLDAIGNNIVEPDLSDVDPWYIPLWNWVNRFAPSVNDFAGSIEVMDDTFDDLPAIPQVTDPPAIPTLPGFE